MRYILLFLIPALLFAKPPAIDGKVVVKKLGELFESHASQKKMTPELVERALNNFLEELDPTKTYFIESEIDKWIRPNQELLDKIILEFTVCEFSVFDAIYCDMEKAIERRDRLEKMIDVETLPDKVDPKDLKDLQWVQNEQELMTRLMLIKAVRLKSLMKFADESADKAFERMNHLRKKYENEILDHDSVTRERVVLSKVLKAFASGFDSNTSYFTPDEATQFLIDVQRRLFGIGAQLRDDFTGLTVTKLIEGGPAIESGELKENDKIIAVDGEPIVGMSITDAVSYIRGEENTPVNLTVIRGEGDNTQTLQITIMRREVVFKENRYEASYEPFGDGVIAYLKLFSFYQDREYSSAADLEKALEEIMNEHKVHGVVLDLRFNSGGMLTQAVAVTGLFITKGIVVSVMGEDDKLQHLRDLDGRQAWGGPLVVMINRASASASEIVAQTLKDYGRALIVGDEQSYGKGSFQTFTLGASGADVNPEGEYKVTRGRYYTVSGVSPQLVGVQSDVVIPGSLSEADIGERFSKYPLATDSIGANFNDDLSDVPFYQRDKIKSLYQFNLQPRLDGYAELIPQLGKNTEYRIQKNKNYQAFLQELKKEEIDLERDTEVTTFGQVDLQLEEAYNIMKDIIVLELINQQQQVIAPAA